MQSAKVKPLGENVLIEPQEAKKQTAQGIYLPESGSGEKPQEGMVIAVGEAKSIKVKKGQRVIFRPYSGTEVKVGEQNYMILKHEDILAVVE